MAVNKKQTSPSVASTAGKALGSSSSSALQKIIGRICVTPSWYSCSNGCEHRSQGRQSFG